MWPGWLRFPSVRRSRVAELDDELRRLETVSRDRNEANRLLAKQQGAGQRADPQAGAGGGRGRGQQAHRRAPRPAGQVSLSRAHEQAQTVVTNLLAAINHTDQ